MNDASLTAAATRGRPRAGEREATFEEFYVAELPRLVALARGLCGPTYAEDVAQEAMLVAYRRWREVNALERPEAWVRRTCSNLAVSTFRRRVVELRAVARLDGRRTTEGLLAATLGAEADEFWAAVRALPARQAQAAALRYVYDLPVAEIAQTLQCTEGTVKQHLSRARHALAAALHVEPGEEER